MIRRFILASTLLFGACSSTPSNTGRTDRAQFLENIWASPKIRDITLSSKYDSVYIAPVHTGHLTSQGWWKNQNTRVREGKLRADAQHLAAYFRDGLNTKIAAFPGNKLRVVDKPGPKTLNLELAIVELVPSKAYWNAGATAAGFVVPGAGLLSAAGSGYIAIEGRMVDGGTHEVLATFSDRRSDPMSPINLRSLTWYEGAESNLDIWADCGAAVLNAPPGSYVSRPSRFTLRPW